MSIKQIISISGDIGSGKSSVANALKQLTGFAILGSGSLQRAIARQRGLTTLALNELSQTDRSVDDEIDAQLVTIGKTQSRLIVDSRLAWHFIPNSFKVYLSVDPMVGARRVFNAHRSSEENLSVQQTLTNNQDRQQLEDSRFTKLYNIHFRDHTNYDLVVDTSYTRPELAAEKINNGYNTWLAGNQQTSVMLVKDMVSVNQ